MRLLVKSLALLLFVVMWGHTLVAQVTMDNTLTPTELVQQVLLGNGVSVSNITFNGQSGDDLNNQIGKFNGTNSLVEFPEAVAMMTAPSGMIADPAFPFDPLNPAITGDADLLAISGQNSVNDCAILEFDFIPNGDSLIFRYVFASTEYNGYTCSGFNDAFGFFISGPGIAGPYSNGAENIALVPNSDIPVAINTINSGTPSNPGNEATCAAANPNWVSDSQYFVANENQPDTDVQFNGMTVTLTAYAEVVCGQEYHIKLAIADANDGGLDSGVFLEAGSFTSNSVVQVGLDVPVGVNDSTLYEGCGEAYLQFIRPSSDAGLEETAYIEVTGTAENGVDFTPMLPDSIVFPSGIDTIFISLSGVPDGVYEGEEFVNVEITNIASNCSGAVLTSDFQFYINEADPMVVSGFDGAIVDCNDDIKLFAEISGGYGDYSYAWSTGEVTDTIYASPGFTSTIFVTVSDTCGVPSEQAEFDIEVPVYPPVVVDVGEDFTVEECDVTINVIPTASGGFGAYSYSWTEYGSVVGVDPTLDYPVSESTTIRLTVTDDCDATGFDEVDILVPPIEISTLLPDVFTAESCLDEIMLPVISEGGIGQKTYTWLVDGVVQAQSQAVFFLYHPSMGQNVVMRAEDECQNIGADSTFIDFDFPPVYITADADTSICERTPVLLHAEPSGGSGGNHIYWEGTESDNGYFQDFPEGSKSYTVMVEDTCGMRAEERVSVDIREIRADFDYAYYDYYSMMFTDYSRATNPTYLWDFGDGDFSDEENPRHQFNDVEEYDVVLTVTDDIGCIDTARYTAIPPLEVYIPNSFTPNGDGINDLFGVKAVNVYEFEIWIVDRWGKEVFNSKDINQKWNGSNNGNEYQSGASVYNYLIKYKGKKEEDAVEITGYVTVLR